MIQSLKTEPRIKRENNIGYILCKVHMWKWPVKKRQTYQNEDQNLRTICVSLGTVNANSLKTKHYSY